MTRRIAVYTGTRAEYGLLHWLLRDIQSSDGLELQIIASAMHFAPEFGETWRDIEADGFRIDARIEMLLASNTRVGVAKSMGIGTLGIADALERLRPDILILLGDRFESLAAAQVALVMGIPIAHLHGGEITEGAYDDAIRHAITKMANLHFTATEDYRRRVIQMGEDPASVFNVGAFGLDHLTRSQMMSRDELFASLGGRISQPYFLVTYHPATAANEDPQKSFSDLLQALEHFQDHQILVTYPNADHGGRALVEMIEKYARENAVRVVAERSLGIRRYQAAVRNASVVVGNSSSGIIEAPALGVPTVNVGARQTGRLASESVLHCPADMQSVFRAVSRALSSEFRQVCRSAINPYGQGQAAARTLAVLRSRAHFPAKRFHDHP